MKLPPNEWVAEQARALSSEKDADSVGALAWNLSVAFKRWADALREEIVGKPREVFTCTACGSGPWDIGWDPHEQPVMRSGGGRICPNCSGAD